MNLPTLRERLEAARAEIKILNAPLKGNLIREFPCILWVWPYKEEYKNV